MKAKKCRECAELFTPRTSLQVACSIKCALILQKKQAIKKAQKEKRDWYSENKTLGNWEAEAKKVFQKWVRLRDANLPCMACGTMTAKEWHGGHLYKAEIYSGVIFDERNVHKCCSKCNVFLGGNELNFRSNLEKKFGLEWVKSLEEDAHATRQKKYTKEELKSIKEIYQRRIKNEEY
jgi:hypothetical protein